MPKNLVICCDGTNNSYQRDLTNVARVSRIAPNIAGLQHVYYDAGVGVEAPGFATRIGATFYRWGGLAFGAGLVKNVVQAYQELVRNYESGDRVFLFGFSRGAYTVRVLVGLIENYGLLKRENEPDVERIVRRFKELFAKEGSKTHRNPAARKEYLDKSFGEARAIQEAKSVQCPVHFLGVWDTVSSLGWAYDPKTFPNTARMPIVSTIRHAIAIDERRAMFRTNRVTVSPGEV